MKNFILLVCILFSSIIGFGQIGEIEEVNAPMSQGTNRGFKVLIPETTEKQVMKAWQKLMKGQDSKTEKIKKQDEYLSPNANIPSLGETAMNVYSQFQKSPAGTYMTVFVDLGGTFINRDMHPDKAAAASAMIRGFASNTAKASITEMVKQETKKLDKLVKEQKGLEKDKAGYEKNIKNAKESITKNEKAIKDNAKAQLDKTKAIKEQEVVTDKTKAELEKY